VNLFVAVVASRLQKIEEVLAGNALEDQEQGVCFEGTIKSYNVGCTGKD
jgi:hypothetical protein